MKTTTTKIILLSLFVFILAAITTLGQSPTQIRRKCTNLSTYERVTVGNIDGDINIDPCPGRSTIFTGSAVLPSVTSLSLASGTAAAPSLNFVASPTTGIYRVAANRFGIATGGVANATFSQIINSGQSAQHLLTNVAADAEFNFTLVPEVGAGGSAALGDCAATVTACLSLTQTTKTANLHGLIIGLGDLGVTGNGTALNIVDSTKTFTPVATGSTAIWDSTGVINHKYLRTITAAGTTGNQTIDKPAGTVNVAAGQAAIVVTNSTVNTSSIPFVVLRTADATCTFVKSAVPTANTLTITLNANCTAETSVGFIITN